MCNTMQLDARELPRPEACGELEWRAAFGVVELGSARAGCGDSAIFLVLDVFPKVWICPRAYRLEIRCERKARGLGYVSRVGCFSMDFAFFLWTAYNDHLRVDGARRAIAYAWMTRVMEILRKGPRDKRKD